MPYNYGYDVGSSYETLSSQLKYEFDSKLNSTSNYCNNRLNEVINNLQNIKNKIINVENKLKEQVDFETWYFSQPWYTKLWWSLRKYNREKVIKIWKINK